VLLPYHIENRIQTNLHNACIMNMRFIKGNKPLLLVTKENKTGIKSIKRLCTDVLNLEPNNYLALAILNDTLWYSGFSIQERESRRGYFLRRLIELRPNKPELLWKLATCLSRQGQYSKAIEVLEELKNHPNYIKHNYIYPIDDRIVNCKKKMERIAKLLAK
jgi:tetratricopeptide (TPR) repeat protein